MKALLAAIALLFPVVIQASEIVTLTQANQTHAVDPADVVELITAVSGPSTYYVRFTMQAGGASPYIHVSPLADRPPVSVLTGVTQIGLSQSPTANTALVVGDASAVTLRITKQAEQFVSPPVIMPAVTDQNYKVELETSTDLQNWIPAVPGDYLGGSTNRFFRVKVSTK